MLTTLRTNSSCLTKTRLSLSPAGCTTRGVRVPYAYPIGPRLSGAVVFLLPAAPALLFFFCMPSPIVHGGLLLSVGGSYAHVHAVVVLDAESIRLLSCDGRPFDRDQ